MPKSKKSRQTSLFDIRIKSADHNVIVLKGPENDASSALLSGVIVLSVLEPIPIKKLTLKLYATLRLNWVDYYQGVKSQVARPMKYEKRVYEYDWDPLNINDYCKNLYENQNQVTGLVSGQEVLNRSNNSSSTSLKSLQKQSRSSVNLSLSFASLANLTHAAQDKSDTHILVQGNYEFPFSTIIPGTIPESVEGLPGCSMVYKLQSTIERGRFAQPLVTKKHIRVVRTITSDAVELSETIAVDNTWPKKVDYSISAPNRAVAIGSTTRVDMLLVPLLKGLKLGNIKVSLVEYYTYCGHVGGHTDERTVFEKTIKKPKGEAGKDIWEELEIGLDGNFYNDGEIELSPDRWNITTYVQIPPSLNVCTQDCDILSNVKVRHKLKFVIGLVNPDGHVSELRATLPIILFISPFVALTARRVEINLEDHAYSANVEDVSVELEDGEEDVLFSIDSDPISPSAVQPPRATGTHADTQDLMAPPNYENRVYDRLWSEIASPVDTPLDSGVNTPRNYLLTSEDSTPYGSSSTGSALFRSSQPLQLQQGFTLNNSQLVENLRLLHLQREGKQQSMDDLAMSSVPVTPSASSSSTSRKPKFSLVSEENDEPDYFSFKSQGTSGNTVGPSLTTGTFVAATPGIPNPGALMSPGATSPIHQHLSRSNSLTDIHSPAESPSPTAKDWDENVLSRVPSYSTAMKSQPVDDLTPMYEPPLPGSSIDLLLLNKRLLAERDQSPKHMATTSTTTKPNKTHLRRSNYGADNPISFELAKSRGSSTTSSPALSRNQSATNLFGFSSSTSVSATKLSKQLGSIPAAPSSSSSTHLQTQQSPPSKSPIRQSNNALNQTSMTPISHQAHPPQQAHVHNQQDHVSSRPTLVSSNSSKSTLNVTNDLKPVRNSSFLNLSKKSHSSVNLGFLHKKKS